MSPKSHRRLFFLLFNNSVSCAEKRCILSRVHNKFYVFLYKRLKYALVTVPRKYRAIINSYHLCGGRYQRERFLRENWRKLRTIHLQHYNLITTRHGRRS